MNSKLKFLRLKYRKVLDPNIFRGLSQDDTIKRRDRAGLLMDYLEENGLELGKEDMNFLLDRMRRLKGEPNLDRIITTRIHQVDDKIVGLEQAMTDVDLDPPQFPIRFGRLAEMIGVEKARENLINIYTQKREELLRNVSQLEKLRDSL